MTLLPALALGAAACSLVLLLARLIEQIAWASCPETIYTPRRSDRPLYASSCVTLALIAASIWSMQ